MMGIQRILAMLCGMTLSGGIAGCAAPGDRPLAAPDSFRTAQVADTLEEEPVVSPRTRQILRCSRESEAVTAQLAHFIVQAAIDRHRLQGGTHVIEAKKATNDLVTFLKWKLGAPLSICMYATSVGFARLDDRFADPATALLLGLVQTDTAEPRVVLPSWLAEYLTKRVPAAVLGQFLDSMGLPASMGPRVASALKPSQAAGDPATLSPLGLDDLDRLVRMAVKIRQHLQDELTPPPPPAGAIERGKRRMPPAKPPAITVQVTGP